MHLVVAPLAFVLFPVRPDVFAMAADLVHEELALIPGAVGKVKFAGSFFFSIDVLAFITRSVGPGLVAVPVLLVILPITVVE